MDFLLDLPSVKLKTMDEYPHVSSVMATRLALDGDWGRGSHHGSIEELEMIDS